MERDPVEKEVEVFSGSVIDANEVEKVLIESLRLGVALFADGVTEDGDGIRSGEYCDVAHYFPSRDIKMRSSLRIRIC